jgi:alkylation response protein AidB-like acyl-CoA dehydrogenase
VELATAVPAPGASPDAQWRERARSFAERVLAPIAAEVDRSDRMPEAVVQQVRQAGFLGLGLSAEYGGSGGDARSVVAVLEELAVESPAIATLVAVHLSVAAAPIRDWGDAAQRERFLRPLASGRWLGAFGLTEPGVGSDAAHLTTRYRREGDGFVLSGGKMFITNASSADLVLIFATRDPGLGNAGISAFIVPKGLPGYTIAQHLDKMGLRGSETNEIVLDGVALPSDALLGPEGQGLHVALQSLTGGRVGIAACALGVARAALEEMVRSARRAPTDAKRTAVARAFVDVSAARALVAEAARLKDAGEPFADAASAAKLFASQAAVRIASTGVEVAGVDGITSGARAGRLLRDARVFPIVEGTTEIQELILGRSLVGRDPAARPND